MHLFCPTGFIFELILLQKVTMRCPDPTEAAKCRQLIRARYSGFGLAPIVIDSSDATGRDGVGDPYLTVFAASAADP
jgi:hypothetical protein